MIRYLVVFVCWVLFKAAHSILSGISVTLLVPIKLVIIWKVATRISSRVIILIGRMIVDWISRPPSILTTIRVNAWVCDYEFGWVDSRHCMWEFVNGWDV